MLNFKRLILLSIVFVISTLFVNAHEATLRSNDNDDLGTILVDANGMTLYTFANDEAGTSNCYEQCETNWPPLLLAEDESATLDHNIPGLVGFTTRTDDTRQVTFNGQPLYYFAGDTAEGDTNGHLLGDVWFVASPTNVGLGHSETLGYFLVAGNGMTLYTFANDSEGTSNCYEQCATNWPPLLVDDEMELSVQPGLAGEFAVTERTDDTLQVTHNGQPLYFWVNDSEAGQTSGHGVGDVWFVDPVPTLSTIEDEELGTILTGPNGMTLYLFANDTETESACVDGCAVNWPPLTVAADEPITLAEGLEGSIDTIERADESLQVTFNGTPLYYFIRDVLPGDTVGQGRGEVWYVINP